MTSKSESTAALSPTKLALLKIRDLKQQLAAAQRGQAGDIAIVSMACRFPRHAHTPEAFWESLMQGTDEVGEVPEDRWDLDAYYDEDPDAPGKMYATKGVFLENLDLMDPDFFGISPREATWVDPQQRLLLEVSWEALERAGWPADRIGSGTGLFVGWMHNDYQNESSDSLLNLNPYIATGSAGSFLCGRLSYYLGLQGPSLAVDTACSSSLVALHLACQSLHRQECDRALVGGVNAIISPTTNILTCKLKALSPSGHSRAFDAAADGYLRGEGCGVVTLRRLADARREGDPILGVIRGSAVGHNGQSSGLTAPNSKAQEQVIRAALERAGVAPAQVEYLEAHGTGTELGDPIEMLAAAAVLGENRNPDRPLLVGSVKTNIGHLEAAAGMAGLIKVLLAMQNETIPAQLNFEEPNPHIPWDRLPVRIVVEPTAWPGKDRHLAGVSAFGMSGTNAHVVIEGPPPNGKSPAAEESHVTSIDSSVSDSRRDKEYHLLTLSGKTENALHDLAARYRHWMSAQPDVHLADVAYTTGAGRRHFDARAALVVHSLQQARDLLDQLERTGDAAGLFQGQQRSTPKVAWQFTGQGSQYVGMAQGLYESQPLFRQTLNQCDRWLQQWRQRSLLDVLFHDQQLVHHTNWTQPGLFAIQMGLARLLESWGFEPDVVLGHSVGQYAAACVAGIMSWEDGLRLISERGRLIGELPTGGAMVAVFAPPNEIEIAIKEHPDVSLAALNGAHTVISGPESAVETVAATFSERGIRCKRLTTSHAFHSQLMQPALDPFQKAADQIGFDVAKLPLVCNVTGQLLPADRILNGKYWREHIREPVRYADSVAMIKELGCEVVLELGPQPVLTGMAATAWPGTAPRLISCLRKDGNDLETLLSAVAHLYVSGVTPDFSSMSSGEQRQRVILPTYPFQRRRFWGPPKPQAYHAAMHLAHPLLGGRRALAGLPNETRHETWISPGQPAWLEDHQVMGDIVFPAAAYVEMALAAAPSQDLQQLVFEKPLRPGQRTCVQSIVRSDAEQQKTIEVHSSPEASSHWTRNFKATVSSTRRQRPPAVDRAAIAARCSQSVEVADFYQMMQGFGLHYGPQFQTIRSLDYCETDVLIRLQATGDLRGYTIPPTLLDGAFRALAIGLMRDGDSSLFLPVGIERVQCFSTVDEAVWCHATWNQSEGEERTADLTLFDDEGHVVARVEDLKVRRLNRAALRQLAGSGPQRLLYELDWRTSRLPAANRSRSQWLIVSQEAAGEQDAGDSSGPELAEVVLGTLVEQDQQAIHVRLVDALTDVEFGERRVRLSGDQPEQWNRLFEYLLNAGWDGQVQGVVWLLGTGSEEGRPVDQPSARTRSNCSGLLALVNALQERNIKHLPRGLQMVTCGGMAARNDEDSDKQNRTRCVAAEQAQYWGLGRVIGAEHPELRCRLIDVSSDEGVSLVDVLLNDSLENQIAIRDGRVLVARLTSLKLSPQQTHTAPEFTVREDACYLITGGLGMLGRQAALWLARRGAQHVVLVSRREPDESTMEFIEQIEQLGCHVHVHPADLGSKSNVRRLFQRFATDLPPLRGVIHAAGLVDDALLADQTWTRFENVLAPKIRGAWMLHELTADLPLDFFVMYSSAASVLGSPGQSNYATANAYLDGLAWQRQALGLPALSVNWGPWTEGMADNEMIRKRLALQGITPLTAAESHEALEKLIASRAAQATVLDVDWRRMRMSLAADAPPLLDDIAPTGIQSRSGDSVLVEKLRKLQGPARKSLIAETVQSELQQVLSMSDAPDPDTPVIEMGLDSLMAVEFSTRLQQLLGNDFAIAPTLLFDYPTVTTLSEHLLDLVTDLPEDESEAEHPEPVSSHTTKDDVAIIGMSCRFPGASNVGEYWENLKRGVDAVREIPADRWNADDYFSSTPAPGKMYTREGGFLDNIGHFDTEFFNISAQEACWVDPQHRLLLEVGWEALEDAGIPTHPLADAQVGVFMGIMSQDYAQLYHVDDIDVIDGFQGAGLAHSAGVGRISYMFGFEGPSIAVDTASSSSLVAVCQATKSLLDGDCNLALAGGVNAILTPSNSLLLCKAKMLSPDGRCKSFSAAANGFGRGEGCGVVALKRRRDAERDGDRILAVIRGTAVSHNGFSGGLTSPSSRSQERVIREALDNAGMQPSRVQYLEAHGTGTELGDPIEIRAAAAVFGNGRPVDQPLLVGSVKANIGHLEAAGGVSGLIKAVLAMQHGTIPGQIHFDEPSQHVPWERLPVKVVAETTPWPEGNERVVGVNALGMSGTNAHVVLSAPGSSEVPSDVEPRASNDDRSHHLLILSARKEAALRQLADRYDHLLRDNADIRLADVCYSAAIGRRHFEHRAACVVESSDEARRFLQSLAKGQEIPGLRVGLSSRGPKLAWLFSDADIEPTRAGRTLYGKEPVFRDVVEQCDQQLQTLGRTLLSRPGVDSNSEDSPKFSLLEWWLHEPAVDAAGRSEDRPEAGVYLFVLQMALARLWQSWGVDPEVVMGEGIGQYAAACVAGVMTLEDGLKLVAAREQLPATVSSVQRPIGMAGAAGSKWDEATLDVFEAIADEIDFFPADRPLVCNLSGRVVPVHRLLGGSYWRRHCAEPIQFSESVRSLSELQCGLFLELGPQTTLAKKLADLWPGSPCECLPSVLPSKDETATMLTSLGKLFVDGLTPDFAGVDRPWPRMKVGLPTYPFQRSRYWITDLSRHASS